MLLLDANQLGDGDLRTSPRFHAYLRIAAHLGTHILLPRISLDEHLQRRQARLIGNLTSERGRLVAEGRSTLEESMSDQQIGEYAHSLILNYGAEIESEVQVTARYAPHQYQEAVERELWRKAPAHPTKGEGARDVLVWLDVLGTKREEANFLISGDTHAFGTNGSLREELQSEFGEGTIHYFIGLVPLTEFLGLQIPSGTARPHLADSTQAAIAQDINSPGMFIHLNSHIPPSERTMRAWTAHWDGLVTLEEGQTKYNFSLEGEHFLCYSQKYRTQKSYVLASMENPFAQAVPWHFHVSGEVTISVRYDGSGIVREMEVLSATIDDRKTSMLFPGGEKMSLAEAQRRR